MQGSLAVDDANVDLAVDLVGGGGGHLDVALLSLTAGLLNLQHQWAQDEVALDGGVVSHWVDLDISDAFQRGESVEGGFGLLGVAVLFGAARLLLCAALALVLLVTAGSWGGAFFLWFLSCFHCLDDWSLLLLRGANGA